MTRFTPLLTALAVAAVLAPLTLPVQAQTAAPAQPAASAPAPDVLRADLGRILLAAQDLLRTSSFKEALAKVREAEAFPNRNAYENYVLDRLRGSAAAGAGEEALAAQSFESALNSSRLQGADRLTVLEALAGSYFRAKEYPRALDAAQRYFAGGGSAAQVGAIQANSLYLSGDYGQTAQTLKQRIQAADTAGKPVDETTLRMLASSYAKLNDEVQYTATLERLLSEFPKKDYWVDLIARVQNRPGFAERQLLDAYRLRLAAGVMNDEAQYTLMAELALQANLPIEARAVLDAGYEAGKLGAGASADKHRLLRDRVRKQAADDEKALARDSGARTADALMASGEALVSAGRVARGIELMEQGVARGGLRRPEEARLRLGQAYLQIGNKAKATAAFKAVSDAPGGIGDIARLWALFAAQS